MKRLLAVVLAWASFAYADVGPIQPPRAGTITVACANTNTTGTLVMPSDQMQRQAEVTNAGAVAVFVEFGSSTITSAVASGYPVLPSQTKVVTIPQTSTTVACISASGTQTVYVTVGIGQ